MPAAPEAPRQAVVDRVRLLQRIADAGQGPALPGRRRQRPTGRLGKPIDALLVASLGRGAGGAQVAPVGQMLGAARTQRPGAAPAAGIAGVAQRRGLLAAAGAVGARRGAGDAPRRRCRVRELLTGVLYGLLRGPLRGPLRGMAGLRAPWRCGGAFRRACWCWMIGPRLSGVSRYCGVSDAGRTRSAFRLRCRARARSS